ncbi:hypothetical protein [Hydrogenophaga sp. NFH-34]|uniref:hypothetical protein n=1 Tax=Hydrogenophaga sp. NFH-34 TaxID=2744446 RepID=UPI001F30AC3D|nr:hypothetical protein [Hydrogenophaga sp. NFH-34]
MTHDELAKDLANHVRGRSVRLVWTDMQLGPSGSPRPDVYSLEPSFVKFRPLAYEVKVSVADYRRDVTSGKWQTYLPYAAGITFAVPAGLINKNDLPEGCGLMTRSEAGWRTVKAPTLRPINTLPHEAWCKLLIDGLGREHSRIALSLSPSFSDEWLARHRIGSKLGKHVRQVLDDRGAAESHFERETEALRKAAEGQAERVRVLEEKLIDEARQKATKVDAVRADLAVALGLPPDSSVSRIKIRAEEHALRLSKDSEVVFLRTALSQVQAALSEALSLPTLANPDWSKRAPL